MCNIFTPEIQNIDSQEHYVKLQEGIIISYAFTRVILFMIEKSPVHMYWTSGVKDPMEGCVPTWNSLKTHQPVPLKKQSNHTYNKYFKKNLTLSPPIL